MNAKSPVTPTLFSILATIIVFPYPRSSTSPPRTLLLSPSLAYPIPADRMNATIALGSNVLPMYVPLLSPPDDGTKTLAPCLPKYVSSPFPSFWPMDHQERTNPPTKPQHKSTWCTTKHYQVPMQTTPQLNDRRRLQLARANMAADNGNPWCEPT